MGRRSGKVEAKLSGEKHSSVLQTLVLQVKMDKAKKDWMEMVGEKESSTEGAAAVNVIQ